MSSVPPLLTPTLPPQAAAATVAAEVAVVQAPPELAAKLAALKLLEAMVVAHKGELAQIKTDLGTLQVKLPLPLPDGSRLALQVGAQLLDGFPALRLTGVDGKPVTPALLAGRAVPAASVARPPVELTAAPRDLVMTATLLKPAPTPGGPPPPPAGTAFPVRLSFPEAAPSPPAAQPAAAAPTAPPFPTAPAALPAAPPAPTPPQGAAAPPLAAAPPATATPAAASPATAAAPAPTHSPAPAAATAAAPPAVPTLQPAAAPSPGAAPTITSAASAAAPTPALPAELPGVVARNSHAGQPLVQTELGLVSLGQAPSLPAGTRVLLQVAGPAVPPEAAAPAAGPWSGLTQAMTLLGQSDPAAAARLAAALPQLGPRLAEGMAVFAAAAQSGALRPVIADRAAQALERAGRGDAARRLLDDVQGGEPHAVRDAGGEWRAMSMPLLNGGAVEPVRLYLRRPDPDDDGSGGAAGGDKGQRFIVDVSLSALGRLQIDGLLRKSRRRLDLLVRTAEPLPAEMRQDIARIFADGCSAAGISGEAGFQVTNRFVEPAAAPAATGVLA